MVKIISDIGYCYGVKHAISVLKKAKDEVKHVYLTHPLIHNKSENQNLMDENNASILNGENPTEEDGILFSAHGHGKEEETPYLGKTKLFDATCPLIISRYQAIEKAREHGDFCYFLGKKNHQETIGFLKNFPFLIFLDVGKDLIEQLSHYPKGKKYGLIPQTTISNDVFQQARTLLKNIGELTFEMPICSRYYGRVRQSIEFLKTVDCKTSACLVLGDISSSNARELKNAIQAQFPDLYVQIALSMDDIERNRLKGKDIYLTSATSCPEEKVLSMKLSLESL